MSTDSELIIEEITAINIRGGKPRVRSEQTKMLWQNATKCLFVLIDVDLIGGCEHVGRPRIVGRCVTREPDHTIGNVLRMAAHRAVLKYLSRKWASQSISMSYSNMRLW